MFNLYEFQSIIFCKLQLQLQLITYKDTRMLLLATYRKKDESRKNLLRILPLKVITVLSGQFSVKCSYQITKYFGPQSYLFFIFTFFLAAFVLLTCNVQLHFPSKKVGVRTIRTTHIFCGFWQSWFQFQRQRSFFIFGGFSDSLLYLQVNLI